MKVNLTFSPLPGERVMKVFPPMVPFGERQWARRLNFYQGRALTDVALRTEQDGRAGRLATTGQMLSPGVMAGLETGVTTLTGSGQAELRLYIAPGRALTADGEDVVVPRAIDIRFDDLPLCSTPSLLAHLNVAELKTGDNSLRQLQGRLPLPAVAVLILRPVTVEAIGNFDPDDPCEIDPRNDAFSDKQMVDGCLPMLYWWSLDPVPPPLPGDAPASWRNRLAYAVFHAEKDHGLDELLPWESAGAPIALIGFDQSWIPEFVDRYSVVRAGGRPRRRGLLAANAGSPFLWQARIQQFAEHVSDLVSRQTPVDRLSPSFASLPPFGLLPRHAVPIMRQRRDTPSTPPLLSFFPPNFAVQASPIPVEELDALIPGTASLLPIDMGAASRVDGATETIRLLVPVPLKVYDPDLLVIEEISPEFESELARLIDLRGQWLRRRQIVREKAQAFYRCIVGDPLVFPSPDPEAIDLDESPGTSALDPAEEASGLTGSGEATVIDDLRLFKKKYAGEGAPPFAKSEIEKFGLDNLDQPLQANLGATKGLEEFIDLLNRKVKYAEDRIDVGFARTQTDIYRIRQIVLGSDAATKLATSPTLAAIAQGQTAGATREDIEKYVERSKTQIKFGLSKEVKIRGGAGIVGAVDPQTVAMQGQADSADKIRDISSAGSYRLGPETGEPAPKSRAGGFAAALNVDKASIAFDRPVKTGVGGKISVGGSGFNPNLAEVGLTPLVQPTKILPLDDLGKAIKPTEPIPVQVTPQEIAEQASIIGKPLDFRTVTISDRIIQPPAPEAKDYSVSNKHDVIDSLLNPADPDLALYLDDIEIPGFHEYDDKGNLQLIDINYSAFDEKETKPVLVPRTRKAPKDTLLSFKTIREKNILPAILQGKHDLDPMDGDEGAFFSHGVRAIDHTVATLRLIEGRVKSYKTFIAACEELLGKLNRFLAQVNARLQVIGNELAEARHDVSIARALIAEENARLDAVNKRRDEILNKYVTFLAFCRVRTATTTIETPSRPVDPGLREAPVPACLHHEVNNPPELRRMIDLLREAPVRWLTKFHPLLDRLDDIDSLAVTVQSAQLRTQVQLPAKQASYVEPKGFYGEALSNVFAAHTQSVMAKRSVATRIELNVSAESNWRMLREHANDLVAPADLIEAAHGRSEVARLSAFELDQIAHIAGCLYEGFGRIPAKARLLWAEQLSQFDASVNLRNLAGLTRWGQRWHEERNAQLIEEFDQQERIARRDLQALVDFLYQQVDPGMTEAVNLINDLVRVAILMASHAPVNEIITGHLPKPVTILKDSLVEVVADPIKVKIGMEVRFFNKENLMIARGVVEDMGAGQAAARVVHTTSQSVALEQNARVQFTSRKVLL